MPKDVGEKRREHVVVERARNIGEWGEKDVSGAYADR
jgi:hypothetical protein